MDRPNAHGPRRLRGNQRWVGRTAGRWGANPTWMRRDWWQFVAEATAGAQSTAGGGRTNGASMVNPWTTRMP